MATTLDSLKAALTTEDATLFSDGENTLLYPFSYNGQMLNIFIHLMEEGGYARFRFPCYLNLQGTAHRERMLEKLLELNMNMKMLKFCLDPADGEISVEVDLPLEDGVPTERQTHRCMYALCYGAVQERERLRTLLETGIYPGSDDAGFQSSLERLLGEDDDEPAVEDGEDGAETIHQINLFDPQSCLSAEVEDILFDGPFEEE